MAWTGRKSARAFRAAAPRFAAVIPGFSSLGPSPCRLPSVPGALDIDENTLQEQVVAYGRGVLPQGSLFYMNDNVQRIGTRTKKQRGILHQILVKRGLHDGMLDLTAVWDPTHPLCLGPSRGVAWIELKRPVDPPPITTDQQNTVDVLRALGHVAGVAQTLEQVEALLLEANAPLRWRLPTRVPT